MLLFKIKNPGLLSAVLFAIIGFIFTYQTVNKPLSDWGNYYYGSRFLIDGKFTEDIYEPYKFNLMVREEGETDIFLNYTPIPPFTALFYTPMQFTNSVTAKIIFSIISVITFAVSFYRFTSYFKISSFWLILIPVIFIFPVRNNIFFGQTYLLIMAMLMEGFAAYAKDRKFTAGFLWSIAILLKLFPGIILLFLLFKKDYRQLGITIAIIGIISLVTAAITGFGLNIEYFTQIMPRMLNNEINDTYASAYQSMHVLLNKVFIYDKLLNPAGAMNNPLLFKIFGYFFSFTALYVCAVFTLDKEREDILKFSIWLLAGLLITGYGSSYSLLLMLFIVLASVSKFKKNVILLFLVFGLVLAITSVPIHLLAGLNVFMQFPRLYLIIAFFILIIPAFKIKPKLKYIYIVPVFAVIMGYLNKPEFNENSEYVFDKEEALLIYDFSESNGKLKIKFIDQNGRNEKELNKEIKFTDTEKTGIINNQVFYNGKQMTFSNGNKLKPMLADDGSIYYLSDKNRGVGFYTLRKLHAAGSR